LARQNALRGLKIEIGRTTVANSLVEAGIEPAPERMRSRTWRQFLNTRRSSACTGAIVDRGAEPAPVLSPGRSRRNRRC
jgi:hypothetical protein